LAETGQGKDGYISFRNTTKYYRTGEVTVRALDGVSADIGEGELCVIVGSSGAGKTTMLNLLGGMDRPSGGALYVAGEDITAFGKKRLTLYRRYDVGFVFQFYNLIQNLTALENVEMAAQIGRDCLDPSTVLREVGLEERMQNFPAQLSGGEQQRVAIARALVKNPALLLCDEPTGALDDATGKSILRLLRDAGRSRGKTVVIVTHNQAICAMADRVIRVRSGRIESVTHNEHPLPVEELEW